MTQTKVGWRAYVDTTTTTSSTLLTSIYGVWNADTLGTSLDSSIYGVYNGDNVNDTSGNARNGTNVNNVTFTTGKVGNAFTFNGSNCVSLPTNAMNLTGDCTFSFWANLTTNTATQVVLSTYYIASSIQYGFIITFNTNGGVSFGAYSGAGTTIFYTYPSGGAISTNTWRHYTITKTNSQIKWYVNGVADNTFNGTYTMSFHPSNPAAIGALYQYNGTSSAEFMSNGSKLDGLTVWNKVLSDSEITSLYNAGTGAEYPFSSQLLPSPNDSVSTNHGTLMNGTTFTTGKIGKAFTFDGVNDYVALPNNSLAFTGDFSMSGWIILNSVSGNQCIISNLSFISPNVSNGWLFVMRNQKLNFELYQNNNTYTVLASTSNLNSSTWYHVAVTRKASTGTKIYINGVLDSSNSSSYNPTYTSSIPIPTSIGAWKYDSSTIAQYTSGKIDGLSVWDKELTSTEVTSLYNSGNGKQYPNY